MEQNEMGCQTQTSQAPVLCVNNCGFFGTAATMNMCSKCYKDFVLKQDQARLAASSFESIVNGNTSNEGEGDIAVTLETKAVSPEVSVISSQTSSESPAGEGTEQVKEGPKRCGTCRKRVGLTGFNCRCGSIFCSIHRYSDKHDCPFDYRAAGQEAIAKANPVVRAEKLDKI
ncbi:hypothetical protein ACS0TY_003281 [Phlomoides rotata]